MKTFKTFVLLVVVCLYAIAQGQQDPSSFSREQAGGEGTVHVPDNYVQDCPPTSIWSQLPSLPADSWIAINSDLSQQYLVYDNFSGLVGPITGVRFWALTAYLDFDWVVCDNEDPMLFDIKFYQDNAGFPGLEMATFSLAVYRVNTGFFYAIGNFPLYLYEVPLPAPVALTSGWISIQGVSVGTPDCWFMWMSSPSGDGLSYQLDPTGYMTQRIEDLSICLVSDREIPISNWALMIGVVLIAMTVAYRYRKWTS